jgi:putative flippase GtrA
VNSWRIPQDWKKLSAQFAKYMAGGSLYFWIGYAVFAVCYSGLHWSWLPSKVMADGIGWTSNYIVQRFWTFSGQIHLREIEHIGRYMSIEGIGFFLDYLLIWILTEAGISPYLGFFISAAFFTVWSWLWYKYWVFPPSKKIASSDISPKA